MTISIKDIARIAHVSPSTVSRALANSSRVKPETRTAIQRLASEMGYFPSQVARSLVTQRTRTIGLLATTITDLFQAEVIQFVEQTALNHSYSVILAHSGSESERELAELQVLRERRVDGIICSRHAPIRRALPCCAGQACRDRSDHMFRKDERVGSVRVDNLGGGQAGDDALAGARTPAHRPYHRAKHGVGQHRAAEGLRTGSGQLRCAGESIAGRAGRQLAPKSGTGHAAAPGAVVASHRRVLLQRRLGAGRHACRTRRRSSRSSRTCRWWGSTTSTWPPTSRPLTTIAQPMRDMGQKAVEMLLALLAGEQKPEDCVLPGRLIVRESTMSPSS